MTIIQKLGLATAMLLALHPDVFSQEQTGMRLERYAGIYSATINPANTGFMPHPWEVSLFSIDAFVENRYAYIADTRLAEVLRRPDDIRYIGDTNPRASREGYLYQHFYEPNGRLYGVAQLRGGGPALAFHIGSSFTVGLSPQIRTLVSSYGIPEALAFSNLDALPRFESRETKALAMAGMGWAEWGLTLGYRFEQDNGLSTSIGITPKYLQGFEGLYARSNDPLFFQKRQRDTLNLSNADVAYGLSFADVLGDSIPYGDQLRRSGSGSGIDLGIAWSMEDDESEDPRDYRWRAGIALLDLGKVQFRQHSVAYRLQSDSSLNIPPDLLTSASNVNEATYQLARRFGQTLQDVTLADQFSIALPTALSMQVDYRIRRNVYLGALWIQRISLGKNSLKRPNTLALTPRFEHKWVSVSLPVVLSDWRSPRFGLAARLGWLYVGSDNLSSLLGKQKFSGTDLYAGLKINGFTLGRLHLPQLKGGGGSRNKQKRGKIKCYRF